MSRVTLHLASGSDIEVDSPSSPPAPRLGRRRRRELAGLWLRSLDLPDIPDSVEKLAPFVARFPHGSGLRRVADDLVRQDLLPTRQAVEAGYLQLQLQTAQWLESLSQAPTPQRIEDLTPHVGRFSKGSRLAAIADQCVQQNRLPTWPNIRAVEEERASHRAARSGHINQLIAEARNADPDLDSRILAEIDRHWALHGRGPTWGDLGRACGVSRQVVNAVIRDLANQSHQVTYTEATGSLRRTQSMGATRRASPGRKDGQTP